MIYGGRKTAWGKRPERQVAAWIYPIIRSRRLLAACCPKYKNTTRAKMAKEIWQSIGLIKRNRRKPERGVPSMTTAKLEKIERIQAEIQQLENLRKRLIQQQKEQERKDRTKNFSIQQKVF